LFRRPLVPVDAHVPRLPPDRHDVDLAVAVEVCCGQVLDRDAARIDVVAGPLRALVVERLVDANAAAFAGLHAQVVAHADDELVAPVAIEVGTPDGMAPLKLFINDIPLPQVPVTRASVVDHHLMTVPWFNGGNVVGAASQVPKLDLARSTTSLGIRLVALVQETKEAIATDTARDSVHALVARRE